MGEKETATADELGVVKTKTKSNQSNDRMAQDDDDDGDDAALKAAEPKKKGDQVSGHESESGMPSYRQGAGGDAGAPSGIAIGDPGVNDNFASNPQGIAVADEGVPAAKPKSK